ncbi:MAG TPA: cysteine--tRNA ligase, partial [Candidatus Paceibacterota bacterium]|nr:cysteine--tRNA ligase [Candidatus Paceibacterota bacterium]
LWKAKKEGEPSWPADIGEGRPGWHLECSAMSMDLLGETFDIHTGGVDHIAVHHNGEIAQSEGATGKPFARFWLHNEFVNITHEKIAKSKGNALSRRELEAHGIAPLAYRYFILSAHYRTSMDFGWEAVGAAQVAYQRLRERVAALPDGGGIDAGYDARFLGSVNDDLGTPQALSLVWDLLKDDAVSDANKKATVLSWDEVLGLRLGEQEMPLLSTEVQELIALRDEARAKGDFAASDVLRAKIEEQGFTVKDTPDGVKITKR